MTLIEKFEGTPMSLADACLARMTDLLDDPLLRTTASDFRIYRGHRRQAVRCVIAP